MSGKYPRTPDEMRSGRHSMERALRIKKARAHYVSRAQRRAADKAAKAAELAPRPIKWLADSSPAIVSGYSFPQFIEDGGSPNLDDFPYGMDF
jgi:hypothetical protein